MSALVVARDPLWDWVPHVSLGGEHIGDLEEDGGGEDETKSVGLKEEYYRKTNISIINFFSGH